MANAKKKSKKELLRQKAERLLSEKPRIASKLEDEDIKKLVHELQVHQVEMEMQNDELRRAREDLEESRTKHSGLYDFAPVGYFTFSQTGVILEVNLTGASLLGVDRSLVLHRSFSAFLDPEFRSLFRDHRLNLLKTGAKERCELKLIGENREPFYASLESISVRNGKKLTIRSAVSDISELKKARDKAETEHAFRIAVENSILSGIAAVDLEGKKFYVNLGFCRMLGRTEEDLVGRKPPVPYWPPEELNRINKAFSTMMNGKALREGFQLRFMRKNGERFDVLLIPSPLKDHRGKVIGWIATIGDITHLKQVESELKQLNTQLEERVKQRTTELENINKQLKQEIAERKRAEESLRYPASFPEINPNPIVEVDMAGTIHYLNPAAKELFPDLSTSGIKHPLLGGLESFAITLGEEQNGALRREVKIGNFWYDQAFFRVPDMDRIRVYSHDITERKQAEAGLTADLAALTRMHDLSGRLLGSEGLQPLLQEVMNAAVAIVGAERGTLQLLESDSLRIVAHYGHQQPFLDFFAAAENRTSVCGEAAQRGERVAVPDVETSSLFAGTPSLAVLREAGVRAVQSTPIISRTGALLGILTTQWGVPYHPDEDDLWRIDLLMRQAADLIEYGKAEEGLRRSRDELEIRVQERTAELATTNERLKEQSKILEGFFTSTITPLVFLDRYFNFVRVNEAYANACQRDVSEFPGHNHFELYPNEENEAIFKQVVETKVPYQVFAKPFSFPDHPEWGVTYWDWTLTPLLDDKGEVEFLVFSLEDVTEQKRTEDAFRKEYNFRKAIENSMVAGVAATDLSGKLIHVNKAFCKMVGWSEDELVRMSPPFVFWPPESAKIAEEIQQSLARGKLPEGFELRLRRRNKDRFDALVSISPLLDTKGETTGWVASFLDITERKRAEEALKAAHQYNRSLIEASLDPLVTISAEGKIMDVNKETELVTGLSRKQLIGTDFSNYFTEPEKARQGYEQVFRDESVRDYPLAIRHTSGKVTNVLYHATVFRNEAGEIQGVFAAARDVTELTEAHRRMEATNSLLNLFVRKSTRKEYLDSVIELIQPWSGCRCVGIRILNEKDYVPYESYVGFNQEFWESENLLSIKYDQCACIRVVTGNPDPQDRPAMTPAGSFRCENTFEFVGSLSEEEKARFRGVCIENGFKSVAIVPIRYRDRVLGAIHLADENEGKAPIDRVEFIESMAPMIGEGINRFNLEEELKDSETRLRSLSSQLLTVQENERKRIAVELHDSIGQMLTAIKFRIESILDERNKKKSLESLVPLVRETIEETRRIQMDLRPSTLDDIGVLATLGWFCREYQKTYSRIRIEKEIGLQESEISIPLKTVIYRLTQEALNNIAKHSKADLIHLSLRAIKDRIELTIKDNGIGFGLEEILSSETPKTGLGLNSMRERTELSGGTFAIETTPGAGTTISASWPI